jgi:carboxyl-terminal processing protease
MKNRSGGGSLAHMKIKKHPSKEDTKGDKSLLPCISEASTRLGRLACLPLIVLLLPLLLPPAVSLGFYGSGDLQEQRAVLVGYLIRQELSNRHYSKKELDDNLSRAAFNLYLKQLDFQKRFLLQEDVDRLSAYSNRIDDEINKGEIALPIICEEFMEQRVTQAQKMVEELLQEGFDLTKEEEMETDPEKLDYCRTERDLRGRWKKALKFQVLTRYLGLLEEKGVEAETQDDHAEPDQKTRQDLLETAISRVKKSHHDFFSRLLREKKQGYYDRYFNSVARAYDPHTNYLPPAQKEDFDIHMRGSLEGIGATLREEDGLIKVVAIIPGSASYRQGQLQPEDTILAVAEGKGEPVDITDAGIFDAVSLIRGKKGTEVKLTVRKPDGRVVVIPIIRDVVEIEETFVKSAPINDERSGKTLGYIKIPSFYRDFDRGMGDNAGRNATDDVRKELETLKAAGIEGLIVDLRDNGGGSLLDAVLTAGLFIEEGPIVQIKDDDGKVEVLSDRDPAIVYTGPVVILVNKFSASASEILAGALQDYGRAIVVGGEHTHGKGTVQTMIDLDKGLLMAKMGKYSPLGALKITVQKFYRISGESTQFRGIVPEIILPDRLGHIESGEQYLDYSLPWDTIDPVEHPVWSVPETDQNQLRAKSAMRVKTNRDFLDISAEYELAMERRGKTTKLLDIEDLRREREAQKALVGAVTSGAHGRQGKTKGDDKDTPQSSEREGQELRIEEITEDPYAGEAMAVLGDMIYLRNSGRLQAATKPQS